MKTLSTIVSILPQIIAAVRAVEQAADLPKTGSAKLELVLSILRAAEPEIEQIKDAVVKVINSVVSFFNAIGVFKRT